MEKLNKRIRELQQELKENPNMQTAINLDSCYALAEQLERIKRG